MNFELTSHVNPVIVDYRYFTFQGHVLGECRCPWTCSVWLDLCQCCIGASQNGCDVPCDETRGGLVFKPFGMEFQNIGVFPLSFHCDQDENVFEMQVQNDMLTCTSSWSKWIFAAGVWCTCGLVCGLVLYALKFVP